MVCFHVHFSSTELIRPDVPRAVHRTLSHVCILLRHTGFLRIQCTSDRALVNCGASCSQTIVAASIRLVADELRIHFQGTYGSTLTSGIALEKNFVISRSISEEQIIGVQIVWAGGIVIANAVIAVIVRDIIDDR